MTEDCKAGQATTRKRGGGGGGGELLDRPWLEWHQEEIEIEVIGKHKP